MRGDDIFLRDVFSRRNFSSSIRETRCSRGASSDAAIVNRRTRSRRRDRDRGRGLERRSDRARGRKNPRMVRRPDGPRGRIGPPPSPRSSPQTETPRGVPTRGVPTQRPRCARRRRVAHATPTPTPTRSPPPVRVPRRVDSLSRCSPRGLVDQTARLFSRPRVSPRRRIPARRRNTRLCPRNSLRIRNTSHRSNTAVPWWYTSPPPCRGSPSTSGRPGKDRRTYSLPSGTAARRGWAGAGETPRRDEAARPTAGRSAGAAEDDTRDSTDSSNTEKTRSKPSPCRTPRRATALCTRSRDNTPEGKGKGRGRGWDTGNHRRHGLGDTTSRIPDPGRGRSRTNFRRTRMNFRGMRADSRSIRNRIRRRPICRRHRSESSRGGRHRGTARRGTRARRHKRRGRGRKGCRGRGRRRRRRRLL